LKSEPNGSRSIELPKCSSGLAQNLKSYAVIRTTWTLVDAVLAKQPLSVGTEFGSFFQQVEV